MCLLTRSASFLVWAQTQLWTEKPVRRQERRLAAAPYVAPVPPEAP